jgi:hypothetical protein
MPVEKTDTTSLEKEPEKYTICHPKPKLIIEIDSVDSASAMGPQPLFHQKP